MKTRLPKIRQKYSVHVQILPEAKTIFQNKKKFLVGIVTADLKKRIVFALNLIQEINSEVTVCFCGAQEIQRLNHTFRKKNKVTDVLSFIPSSEKYFSLSQGKNLGEIVICVEKCFEQSKEHRVSLSDECEKMVVHGLVHLLGFDHERSKPAYNVMNGLELLLRKEITKEFGKPQWCSLKRVMLYE